VSDYRGRTTFRSVSVQDFFQSIGSDDPTPGGGTASAMAGAMGASLVLMVAVLTEGKKKYRDVREEVGRVLQEGELLREELLDLADEDSEAFDGVMTALRLPRDTEREKKARSRALQEATRQAAEVPRQIMVRCHRVLALAVNMAEVGNSNAVSDALVAGELAAAGARGGAANVMINLSSLRDEEYSAEVTCQLEQMQSEAEGMLQQLREVVDERM